ncbi:MAG: DUF4445 domain-containing protein [Verrucomicrobia bacterium]|nr:DUF4445 domain-containing protein [Verrucomicrobiota bacterium]
MPPSVRLELLPLGTTLTVEQGTPLQNVLFEQGVEFPCGGRGRCKGCRVKVLAGSAPPTPDDQRLLSAAELAEGWRLACRMRALTDLQIELAQWDAPILSDDSAFEFHPRPGYGVAVDLGTTTLVAQLLDLRTGRVLGVRTALNAQARHGADLMSRIDFALADNGQQQLQTLIREQIGGLVGELLRTTGHTVGDLTDMVLVGNTAMHHLFCGVPVSPLAHHPFTPTDDGPKHFRVLPPAPSTREPPAAQPSRPLAFDAIPSPPDPPVPGAHPPRGPADGATAHFLPCLGGFVGSDVLGGILATRLHESPELVALVDLGTNGEIVVGNRDRLLCSSTAAGPAFEGARIASGMRAATGAISEVSVKDGQFQCGVLGRSAPRGICGSGLVDAVAGGLDLRRIHPSGRLADGKRMPLCPPVEITQADIRELQLAKGAIAAGIRILMELYGAPLDELRRIYLAGAFGNYINLQSAARIGLLPFSSERVVAAGNTALLGAKLALFNLPETQGAYDDLRRLITHVSLREHPRFQDVFVEELTFPQPSAPNA